MPKTKLKQSKKQPINIYGKAVIGVSTIQIFLYASALKIEYDTSSPSSGLEGLAAIVPMTLYVLLGIPNIVLYVLYIKSASRDLHNKKIVKNLFSVTVVLLLLYWPVLALVR